MRTFRVKASNRVSLLVVAVAVVTINIAHPRQLSAENATSSSGTSSTAAQWSVQVDNVDPGDVADLLILKTTVQKYTAGSETRRAVTTVSGATKLTVRSQLCARDGHIILERTVNGNVRFMGSNLRATHNLARNVAKAIKQSSLPEPSHSASHAAIDSDQVVVVELR